MRFNQVDGMTIESGYRTRIDNNISDSEYVNLETL